ncbi:M4 family metallopeptidase [Desulfocurvibacter africanus]|uniref:M4 family metallopeptidase n=1 Tax=Desulfocurvibacter africanus TaxID=873 RepID=UPI002FD8C636
MSLPVTNSHPLMRILMLALMLLTCAGLTDARAGESRLDSGDAGILISPAGTPRRIMVDLGDRGPQAYPERFRTAPDKEADLAAAMEFLLSREELLGLQDSARELALQAYTTDELGRRQLRFAQRYKGLPVWPAEILVHVDPAGRVDLMEGAYIPTPLGLRTAPLVKADAAESKARDALDGLAGESALALLEGKPELIVYMGGGSQPRLAWKVILNRSVASRWLILVDAVTRQALLAYDTIMEDNHSGSGQDLLGETVPLNVWEDEGLYYLLDTSKPMFRGIEEYMESGTIPVHDFAGQDPLLGFNPRLVESASPDSGWLPDGVSAAYNLSETYDYYFERHGRDSIDDQGMSVRAYVRVGGSILSNACWNPGLESFFFGAGQRAVAGLDVVAHEFTHGVVDCASSLLYYGESGALHEAWADIFGCAVEARTMGATDWVGGTVFSERYQRSLADPASREIVPGRPYPSHVDEMVTPDDPLLGEDYAADNGAVHWNCTVVSHAFYLLAEGQDDAIGIEDTEEIFFRAVTRHMPPASRFLDARLACLASAEEIFGSDSAQVRATEAAFDAVGIVEPQPSPPSDSSDDAMVCLLLATEQGQDAVWSLGRLDPARDDDPQGERISRTPAALAPPAVSNDGSLAAFVSADHDACTVDMDSLEENCLGLEDEVASVALSPDGSLMAYVPLTEAEELADHFVLHDVATGEEVPVLFVDEAGNSVFLVVNSVDFATDGHTLAFDVLAPIEEEDGTRTVAWVVIVANLDSMQAYALAAQDTPLASPAMGNQSLEHISLEVLTGLDGPEALSLVSAGDLSLLNFAPVAQTAPLAVPSFNGDDSAVLYSAPDSRTQAPAIWRVPMDMANLRTLGNPEMILANALYAQAYESGSTAGDAQSETDDANLRLPAAPMRFDMRTVDVRSIGLGDQ